MAFRGNMQEPKKQRAREARRGVSREALAIYDEGRLTSPCTIANISRSGLALRGLAITDMQNAVLILDIAAEVVFEGVVVRRKDSVSGIRLKGAFALSKLPERLAFVATIRLPTRT